MAVLRRLTVFQHVEPRPQHHSTRRATVPTSPKSGSRLHRAEIAEQRRPGSVDRPGGMHLKPVDAVGAIVARRTPDVDGTRRQRPVPAAAAFLDVVDELQPLQVLVGLAVQLEVGLEGRAVLAERAEVDAGGDDRHAGRLFAAVELL